MKKLLIFALSAVLLAAGCAKENLDSAKNAIVIDPTIADPELFPKTATRATDTDFEPGDRIGVTIRVDGQTHISNREFTFDGATQFFTAPNVRWYDDTSRTAELSAYYPYQAGAEAPVDFAVLPDQNGDNYKASDFIAGLKQEVLPDKKVDLVFKHKMARLIVHVTNETDFDITEILFKGTVGTGCYDCTTCEFCVKAGAATLDIKACERRKNELYYALLIPQNGVEITAAVITDDGEERDGIIEDPKTGLGAVDLVSGCNRELDLIVTQDGLRIQLSGDIDPWEDGEDIDTDNGDDDKDPEPAQNTVSWGGVEYKTVTLKDGRTWMAENLRYVPDGKTVSSDPADGNGIWYPCDLNKVVDPTLVDTYGLIYSYPVLLGMTEGLSADNYDKFEGVQGICPDGWHIPTKAEWLKIAGQGSGGLKDETSPYFEAAQQGAPIPALNADGFNMSGCGYINAANITAKPAYIANASAANATAYAMGYFAGSSAYQVTYNTNGDPTSGIKNIQYYAGMLTYNASYHRLQVAFQGAYGGAPVRCIKNADGQ